MEQHKVVKLIFQLAAGEMETLNVLLLGELRMGEQLKLCPGLVSP